MAVVDHRRTARVRVLVVAVVGVAAGVLALLLGAGRLSIDIGWVALCAVYLPWVWLRIGGMDPDATSRHATRESPARSASDVLLLCASAASIVAELLVLSGAKNARGGGKDLLAILAVVSIAASWLMVHTLFTLRYAVLYFSGRDGGISFNQKVSPRYVDFAYVAFTVGMTFQVSDTDLTTPAVRATALRHALLSYLFGAVVIASTVNLVANLAG